MLGGDFPRLWNQPIRPMRTMMHCIKKKKKNRRWDRGWEGRVSRYRFSFPSLLKKERMLALILQQKKISLKRASQESGKKSPWSHYLLGPECQPWTCWFSHLCLMEDENEGFGGKTPGCGGEEVDSMEQLLSQSLGLITTHEMLLDKRNTERQFGPSVQCQTNRVKWLGGVGWNSKGLVVS